MPRLPLVPLDEADPRLARYYRDSLQKTGQIPPFLAAGANAPELVEWYYESFYAQLFYGGRVETRLKELVRLHLSKTHGCLT